MQTTATTCQSRSLITKGSFWALIFIFDELNTDEFVHAWMSKEVSKWIISPILCRLAPIYKPSTNFLGHPSGQHVETNYLSEWLRKHSRTRMFSSPNPEQFRWITDSKALWGQSNLLLRASQYVVGKLVEGHFLMVSRSRNQCIYIIYHNKDKVSRLWGNNMEATHDPTIN